MHETGFEPASLTTPELKSGPLDRSGKQAYYLLYFFDLIQFCTKKKEKEKEKGKGKRKRKRKRKKEKEKEKEKKKKKKKI